MFNYYEQFIDRKLLCFGEDETKYVLLNRKKNDTTMLNIAYNFSMQI